MAYDAGIKLAVDGASDFKSALSGVDSQIKNLNAQLKNAVEALNSTEDKEAVLAKQSEILGNKQSALQEKIQVLTKEYSDNQSKLSELNAKLQEAIKLNGANSDEALKAERAYNKQATEVNNLGTKLQNAETELLKTKNQMAELKTQTDNTGDSLEEAGNQGSMFGDILKGNIVSEAIIKGVSMLADAFKNVVGSIKDAVIGGAQWADDLLTLSTQTGISTDKLQEMQYMADLVDTSVETITGSMKKNIKSMDSAAKGSATYADAYAQLGVAVTDADGNLRDSETVFYEALDALGAMANETERDALAMTLFGKSAQDLNPLIQAGSETMAQLAQEAHNVGYVMGGEDLAALGGVSDAMARMDLKVQALKNGFAAELAPAVEVIIGWLTTLLENIDIVIPVVLGLTTAVAGLAVAMNFSKIVDMLTNSQNLLNAAMNANPIMLVVSLIAGLVVALITAYNTSEDFRNIVNGAFEAIKAIVMPIIDGIKQAIKGGIPGAIEAAKKVITALPGKIKEIGTNIIKGLWNGINNAKDWLIGKISGFCESALGAIKAFFGIKSPSKVMEKEVGAMIGEGLAKGIIGSEGIVDKAMLGLSNSLMSTNLQLPIDYATNAGLERAAAGTVTGLSAQTGGNYIIQLVTDGRTLAEVVFNPLTGVARQKGVAWNG